jgi:thioesterase domain-containing protein
LQPRGLCGQLVPHSDVESAARAYLHAIRELVPHGPIHLVGHSYGGWVAAELARQWLEQGGQPGALIVLDSRAPSGTQPPARCHTRAEALERLVQLYEMNLGRPMQLAAADFAVLESEQQLQLLLSKLIEFRIMPANTRIEALRGIVRVFASNINTRYLPDAGYPHPVHLVLAPGERGADDAERLAQWRHHAPQTQLWRAPGNHLTLLSQPHVQALADWMRPLLLTAGPVPGEAHEQRMQTC